MDDDNGESSNQRNRIHPHKFTLWVAMHHNDVRGITAPISCGNQANWLQFSMPVVFWYSIVVIMLSSLYNAFSLKVITY